MTDKHVQTDILRGRTGRAEARDQGPGCGAVPDWTLAGRQPGTGAGDRHYFDGADLCHTRRRSSPDDWIGAGPQMGKVCPSRN